jgi:hypothetical protein
MYDTTFLVQVSQRLCDLHNDVPAEIFAEIGQTHNLVEELAARAEFQNDVVVLS